MNIGIACYPTLGGSGIVATELGQALAARGHQVHFISYGLPFRLNLDQPGIHFHEVEVNEYPLFKYPDYTLPLSVKMAECSREHALDILHVHYAVPHATAAYLAKKMLGIAALDRPRIITTLHGTDITLVSQEASYRPIIKHSIEHSCGVTAVSASLRDQTYDTLEVNKDIRVIHNFVDPIAPTIGRIAMRAELGLANEDVVLIHSSNLRAVKRLPDILRLVAASTHRDRVKLLILSGGQFSEYQPLVEELGLQSNVIVKERVLAVENYFNAADIGILASEKESFGLSLLEAMVYGCPVLATRVGGMPEVVTDGETGLLFELGDVAAGAALLDQLVSQPQRRQTMGEAARRHARHHFSTEIIVQQYLDYYEEIIATCP